MIVSKQTYSRNRWVIIALLVLITLFFVACSNNASRAQFRYFLSNRLFPPESATNFQKAEPDFVAIGSSAMVASESTLASEVGRDVIKRGGNAIDAAIAVSFLVAVYRPQSTGIGGGGFMLIYKPDLDQSVFLDFRERAPRNASTTMFIASEGASDDLSRVGGLAVAVPGLVAGLWEAYQQHGSGKIPWAQLVAPAAKMAKEGFEVYPHLAEAIGWFVENQYHKRFPDLAKLLLRADGTPKLVGDIFTQPRLAETLKKIAVAGPKAFYEGAVADDIVSSNRKYGGILEKSDLLNYEVKYRDVIEGEFRGYRVISSPPPSSGG
ncbi:MAG: gamma-glutamyltransferase, partial [Bdellovibrionales bacterium]|nr:gamma-glutamyltransferase [Bdellovibrionales bacterium]